MKKISIFVVKDCFNCPLSEYINPNIVCKSTSSKVPKDNILGSFEEVEKGLSIPAWCPLEDYKEANQ